MRKITLQNKFINELFSQLKFFTLSYRIKTPITALSDNYNPLKYLSTYYSSLRYTSIYKYTFEILSLTARFYK